MKIFREARLTDFYDRSVLQVAANAIWSQMKEQCDLNDVRFEEFRHRNYVGDYTFGFSRILAILHTVKPAKQFYGTAFAEEFWRMIWDTEFDAWEIDYYIADTMSRFSQRLSSVNRAYSDGHQDGVSYFASLPFDGKITHLGSMFFGQPFICLVYSIKEKAKEA